MVKNLPAMRETWVWSLGQEDTLGLVKGMATLLHLEKGMATHSSILAWRIPWTEEPGRLQSMGSQRVRHDWVTNTHQIRSLKSTPINCLSYLLLNNRRKAILYWVTDESCTNWYKITTNSLSLWSFSLWNYCFLKLLFKAMV